MKLVFLGPPGAGKGTQAGGVSKALSIMHISTGDMFRGAIRDKTPTGVKAKAFIDAGQLVPDAVTIEMVHERLSQADCANGYLLDGFPRSIEQAEALQAFAAPDAVVVIDIPDQPLIERLTGRRVCPKCNGTFHVNSLGGSAVCPVCAGTLVHREDDQIATIQNRLRVYHEQTSPLIGYYEKQGLLLKVDGDQAPERVQESILGLLRACK